MKTATVESTVDGWRYARIGCVAVTAMLAYQTLISCGEGLGWWQSLRLYRHNVSTHGRIVQHSRSGHLCGVAYEFRVDARTYTGGEAGCEWPVGASVAVYYWPTDPGLPGNRTIRTPWENLREDLESMFVLGVVVPAGFTWCAYAYKRGQSSRSTMSI